MSTCDRGSHHSLYGVSGLPLYLQKTYDSIEFPVLLDRLFQAGVNGKMWRFIKNWYQNGVCAVK